MSTSFVRAVAIFVGIAACSWWSKAHAQAWVGPAGSLDLSLDYNFGKSDKVVVDKGTDFANAGTTTHQETISAEYVPVEHLAIDLAIPLAELEYTGDKTIYPHPGGGTYDDGKFHTTFTDLRFGAHYQLPVEELAITPIVEYSIPLQKYETVGNTVAGRHLQALHVGLALGKQFLEAAYVQAVYQYSIVQSYDRTEDTKRNNQDTSDGSFAIGYRFLEGGKLDVNLDAAFHITHGGINFSDFGTLPADDVLYHDPILRETQFLIGGGIGYRLVDSLSIAAKYMVFVAGANTQNANVLGIGLTYSPL